MTEPNFFIIGAPKCGTTSIATWLSGHPDVYMSPVKEPHYFNDDMIYRKYIDYKNYISLFDNAKFQHIAVGEASVYYLYSSNAISNIENSIKGSKYIVLIRNPTNLAISLHRQYVFSQVEDIEEFYSAWQLSDKRISGKCLPELCHDQALLDYKNVCKIGSQIERLYELVSPERVLVITLDNLKTKPLQEAVRVSTFLGITQEYDIPIPVANPAKRTRSKLLAKQLRKAVILKTRLGIPWLGGIGEKLAKLNSIASASQTVPEAVRAELDDFFRDEREKIFNITGHWV